MFKKSKNALKHPPIFINFTLLIYLPHFLLLKIYRWKKKRFSSSLNNFCSIFSVCWTKLILYIFLFHFFPPPASSTLSLSYHCFLITSHLHRIVEHIHTRELWVSVCGTYNQKFLYQMVSFDWRESMRVAILLCVCEEKKKKINTYLRAICSMRRRKKSN